MSSPSAPLPRADYQLADGLWAASGVVFLTGTQALVRLMLMQRQLDAARGLDTKGFVSGYRGSPLGLLDQAIWKAGPGFAAAGLRFVPAVNEELAATQVLGTQRVALDPERTTDGVFALWYGKGPGVDRAGDALKHGHAFGSAALGGVLVVAGDDHGCVSSSMPHQSDQAFMAWGMPVLQPATVAEFLEFGLYGIALSRFSGAWVGFAALSEVVESAATVDLDAVQARVAAWADADGVRAATGHAAPPDGLHIRWPDLPSLAIEARGAAKLGAVAAFARINAVDRVVIASDHAKVGIVTCGKAHLDVMEVLRRLDLTPDALSRAGVRLYKVGLSFPLEATRARAFGEGLAELLVVEEKGAVVETQLRDLFYNAAPSARPAIVGKLDRDGQPLVSALGELRPSRLIEVLAGWLARHLGDQAFGDFLQHVRDFTPPPLLANAADGVRRLPFFCAGCPHNTSTRVPEGSTARAGIGCHFMANWMDRSTAGLIQMGGEGVDWVAQAMFSRTPHVFQNLGDGTYFHSGHLAIRQAVAAGATLTYKILFNDAVAMTGGQPVDGTLTVEAVARQVHAEGVQAVAVVSDAIGPHLQRRDRFPPGTTFDRRDDLDAVQRRLREVPGVTVLVYEQTCAAELRRRRRKGTAPPAPQRLVINDAVCEGCGDCTVQSNCVAVLPHDTPLGRKRRIDQTHCNQDASCAKGFCPSFVGVRGGRLRRRAGALAAQEAAFLSRVEALPRPPLHRWDGPYDLLITGVGGTGVVTVGATIAMAAHLDGHRASVLDFMGFAQKGGAVLSFVRVADTPDRLNQVRIDTQQADAVLACDAVVGSSPEALQAVRHGRTRMLVNVHETPVADALRESDARVPVDLLLAKMRFVAGDAQVETFDAQALAEAFLGDTLAANVLAMGYAWQRGLVPVSLDALSRAIALNDVAVATNRVALALGRLAAADPGALQAWRDGPPTPPVDESLAGLVARGVDHLTAYQDAAWAARFEARVRQVAQAEAALGADPALPLACTVARSLHKLMACKDEYEVARLYTDGRFRTQLAEQFEGDLALEFHLAPPLLSRPRHGQPPRKLRLGGWMMPVMAVLARGKVLRGTVWDVFGHTAERRGERALIDQYDARLTELLGVVAPGNLALVTQIAALPLAMRGFGHVKAANVAAARAREAELLHRLLPARHPKPAPAGQAGQFRGIPVVRG